MEAIADFIVKHRLKILICFICLTVFFGYGFSKLNYSVSLHELIPPHHPFAQLEFKYGSKFGGINTIVVEYHKTGNRDIFNAEDLKKIDRITKAINASNDVNNYLTMSITMRKAKDIKAGAGGIINIEALVWNKDLDSVSKLNELKRSVFTNPLYNGSIVSGDGKATLIIAGLKPEADYQKAFSLFKDITDREENETTKINIVGRPILLGWIYHILPNMRINFLVSGLLMLALLIYFFRGRVIGLVVPLIVLVLSTIWGLGFMGFIGWSLNPLMIVIPFIIGAVVISHSIQNTLRYYEMYEKFNDKKKAVKETIVSMFMPTACGIATDTCGFTVLALAQILIIQKIAISRTFWMLAVFLFVSFFAPLMYLYLPSPRKRERKGERGGATIEDKLCMDLARIIKDRGKWVVVVLTAIIAGGGVYFSSQLKIGNTTQGSQILWPDSDYNLAIGGINERFENFGTASMALYADCAKDGGAKSYEVLLAMDSFQNYMKRKMPEKCGGSASFIPIIKKLNMEFHEGDPKYYRIPDNKATIGSLLWLYEGKLKPGEFRQYRIDDRYRLTNLRLFFKDDRPETIKEALKHSGDYFNSRPKIKDVELIWPGGQIGLESAINEAVAESRTTIILVVMTIVFLFLVVTFRSFVAGIILSIPLLLSNLIAESYMVLRGIGLTIHILALAAIGLSLGINFGVYLYTRYKEEYALYPDMESAIVTGAGTVGRGVLYSGLAMVLPVLTWFFFAGIRFWGDMGLLLAILIGVNFICALVFHPAMVAIIKPKFITKGN